MYETGSLIHPWWECKMASSLWKIVWLYFKKGVNIQDQGESQGEDLPDPGIKAGSPETFFY